MRYANIDDPVFEIAIKLAGIYVAKVSTVYSHVFLMAILNSQ